MERRPLGRIGDVSVLTLGGGGLGQIWGETTRDEAVATVHAAVDAGIDLLDVAPSYGRGEAEAVIGAAFGGRLPDGVRIGTKVMLGTPDRPAADVIRRSLERSLTALQLDRVDLFFLHSYVIPDEVAYPRLEGIQHRVATPWSVYVDGWRATAEALVAEGLVGAWGITGTGPPDSILRAIQDAPHPAVVQAIANPLDSGAEIIRYDEPERHRDVIAAAHAAGAGVLGIRAAGAGAFTDAIDRELPADHEVVRDFGRAEPLRTIARELGVSTAALAHRYALTVPGVDTVILGVKDRTELAECVSAAAAGPLEPDLVARIDAAVGRVRD